MVNSMDGPAVVEDQHLICQILHNIVGHNLNLLCLRSIISRDVKDFTSWLVLGTMLSADSGLIVVEGNVRI